MELASAAWAVGLRVMDVTVRSYFRPRWRIVRALVRITGLAASGVPRRNHHSSHLSLLKGRYPV